MPFARIARAVVRLFRGSASPTSRPAAETAPSRPTRTDTARRVPEAEELTPAQERIAEGIWITVRSSWIDQIRWDWRTKATDMKTIGGGWYRYEGKPMDLEVVDAWTSATSAGRFWWSNIRGVYSPATRIRKAPSRRGLGRVKPNVIYARH